MEVIAAGWVYGVEDQIKVLGTRSVYIFNLGTFFSFILFLVVSFMGPYSVAEFNGLAVGLPFGAVLWLCTVLAALDQSNDNGRSYKQKLEILFMKVR